MVHFDKRQWAHAKQSEMRNPKFLKAEARTEFFSSQNEDGVALSVAFNDWPTNSKNCHRYFAYKKVRLFVRFTE